MPLSRKRSFLARILILAGPLAIAAVPLSATPVSILSAACVGPSVAGSPADPSSCKSLTSQGNVSESMQYFSNGFTLSVIETGTASTSANQGGTFALDAVVPVNFSVSGSSRGLVVNTSSSTSETLDADAGTVGQIRYGFNNFTVISRNFAGGDPVSFDFENSSPATTESWTSDEIVGHNFGLSLGVVSSITSGSLSGSMSESETFLFYEADGVTPVDLVFAQAPEPASLWLLLVAIPICYLVSRMNRQRVGVKI
jgi:hypothetical protein